MCLFTSLVFWSDYHRTLLLFSPLFVALCKNRFSVTLLLDAQQFVSALEGSSTRLLFVCLCFIGLVQNNNIEWREIKQTNNSHTRGSGLENNRDQMMGLLNVGLAELVTGEAQCGSTR